MFVSIRKDIFLNRKKIAVAKRRRAVEIFLRGLTLIYQPFVNQPNFQGTSFPHQDNHPYSTPPQHQITSLLPHGHNINIKTITDFHLTETNQFNI